MCVSMPWNCAMFYWITFWPKWMQMCHTTDEKAVCQLSKEELQIWAIASSAIKWRWLVLLIQRFKLLLHCGANKYLNYQYLCYGNMFQLADFKESHRFAWFSARGGRMKAVETVYVKIKSKFESFFCCPFKNLNDLPQCVILLYQLDSYEFVRKQLCFQTKKHFYLRPLHWIVFFFDILQK